MKILLRTVRMILSGCKLLLLVLLPEVGMIWRSASEKCVLVHGWDSCVRCLSVCLSAAHRA